MLVVHGLWSYGAVQLWAEDSSLPALAPARGRPSRAPRARELAAAIPPLCRAADDVPAGIALAGALDARSRRMHPEYIWDPVRTGLEYRRSGHT